MENYRAIRQNVIDASLAAQRMGLIHGTSGNISVRSEDKKVIAITPTSVPYEELTWDMIPLVNETGAIIEAPYKPSSELLMHTAVMFARQDVNAVVHTHCKYAILLSIIEQPLLVTTVPMIGYAPDCAPIVPFKIPGSRDLADAVVKGLGKSGNAVILEFHGLLTAAVSLEKAMTCSEYINEAAEITYLARLVNKEVRSIDLQEIDRMMQILKSGRAL